MNVRLYTLIQEIINNASLLKDHYLTVSQNETYKNENPIEETNNRSVLLKYIHPEDGNNTQRPSKKYVNFRDYFEHTKIAKRNTLYQYRKHCPRFEQLCRETRIGPEVDVISSAYYFLSEGGKRLRARSLKFLKEVHSMLNHDAEDLYPNLSNYLNRGK